MSALRVLEADSARGRRAIDRLTGRGAQILDRKTLRATERILGAVRKEGDAALLRYARELDGSGAADAAGLRLRPTGAALRGEGLPPGFADALETAIGAVERFHRLQDARGYAGADPGTPGVEWEERVQPLRRAGVYVPGGRASYPSTAVMTVIPARIAGVREIAVATPPHSYLSNPALMYTLARLGVEEVWGMGGAHAVAAFAYGTESVGRVDKIAGPGNAWVTAAKKLVAGDVGIDGIAGPSEVVIVAGAGADAGDLAADLLAQAEHDPQAAALLLTTDPALAREVAREVEVQLSSLTTAETARRSLLRYGAALVVPSMEEALGLVERIAPEHLQLVGAEAEALSGRVVNAGAIFVGASTPEVFGDYVAGPSHVLPTCGSARFASSLGVDDFRRRSHVLRFSREAAASRAGAAEALALAEGLPAHAAAARRRLG